MLNLISCKQKVIEVENENTEKVLKKADSILIDHDHKKEETIKIMEKIILNDSLKKSK